MNGTISRLAGTNSMVHVRLATEEPGSGRVSEWLTFIRTANGLYPDFFGKPDSLDAWWTGGTVEEYAHARIIHRDDPSVSIVSKDTYGADVLRATAAELHITIN